MLKLQGGLVCCSPRGRYESNTTEELNHNQKRFDEKEKKLMKAGVTQESFLEMASYELRFE